MNAALSIPTLSGRRVRLEPLAPEHAEPLVAAAEFDTTSFTYTTVPRTLRGMEDQIRRLLSAHASGSGDAVPFVRLHLPSRTAGGMTGC